MLRYAARCCKVRIGEARVRASEETVRVTATISRQQERLLKALAERHKVSVAWLIRHAIDRMLSEGDSLQLPLDLGNRR